MAYSPSFIDATVVSTRIRLARNFAAYPFPKKMDEAQAEDIIVLVRAGLKRFDEFKEYDLRELSAERAKQLQERYLISPALLKNKCSAAFVSSDESISIMVNEEDHLREQYICNGFDLYKAYERISGIDDGLSAIYDFAFDDKLGYLTACPSNLGTGMRASVMLFLPGLVLTDGLKGLFPEIRGAGMTVRGAFGEGSGGEGYLYQVSNERTLGWSEEEILEGMVKITMRLCNEERNAREKLLKSDGAELKDKCLRAYGVLTNCVILSEEEFLAKMADVRMGLVLGFMEALDKKGFEDFERDMRPATFRVSNSLQGKRQRYCDLVRAETVCNVLPELVRVKRGR